MFCEEVHLYGSNLQQKMAAHICLNTQVMMSDTQAVELQTKVPEDYAKFYNHGEGLSLLGPIRVGG